MKSKIKILSAIAIILLIPFIIVNIVSFNNDLISFNFSNIKNIFFFNGIINSDGLKLYFSLFTVISLILFYWRWQTDNQAQKIADMNGLCEELRHNLNITDQFLDYDKNIFYSTIKKEISKLNMNDLKKYPSPCDFQNNPSQYNELKNLVTFKSAPSTSVNYFKLRNDFVNSAISSKTYFSLNNQRIFLNLGHLNYSIMRHNLNIEKFNSNLLSFNDLQNEYFLWVHFRLHFVLIDLLLSADTGVFIDKGYIDEIKSFMN